MLYAIYCKDKPNHLQTRLDNRPGHVDYLKLFAGQHVCTGPLLSDDGLGMVGSLLVMEFADRTAAEDFAAKIRIRRRACSSASQSHRSARCSPKPERDCA